VAGVGQSGTEGDGRYESHERIEALSGTPVDPAFWGVSMRNNSFGRPAFEGVLQLDVGVCQA